MRECIRTHDPIHLQQMSVVENAGIQIGTLVGASTQAGTFANKARKMPADAEARLVSVSVVGTPERMKQRTKRRLQERRCQPRKLKR